MEMAGTAGAVPTPDRLLVAVTAPVVETVSTATFEPVVAGVNTSLTVQEPPILSVPAFVHVPVPLSVKSAAFVPVIVLKGVCNVAAALPLFVTVKVNGELGRLCVTLPKLAGLGAIASTAAVATPVPVIAEEALTVPRMFSVAVRDPAAPGANVRIIVQLPGKTIVPASTHVPPVRAKSAALVPVSV